MPDFVYLALTLLSFAGFALLIGALDKRLAAEPDPTDDPADPTDPADPVDPADLAVPGEVGRDEVDAR